MSIIRSTVLLLICFCLCSAAGQALSISKVKSQIIRIQSHEKGIRHNGTGTMLTSDGWGVTNLHVIGSKPISVWFTFSDREKIHVKGEHACVYVDVVQDLCYFHVNKKTNAFDQANKSDSNNESALYTIGHPKGQLWTIGRAWGLETTHDDSIVKRTWVYAYTNRVNHGSSGGAVFNSNNQLIGITTAIRENHCKMVPADVVWEGLLQAKGMDPKTDL